MADLDIVILTFNEERHIRRAIAGVRDIARQIIVVDSFSTDRTVAIAEELGAFVLQNRFVNQAKQFQWGLDHAPLTATWTMRLDADEVIEPDLALEIATRLPAIGIDIAGINLKRKHFFLGRWVRHGGRYPLVLLRIWRRGQGRVEDRWMDEHLFVWGGRTITFDGGFRDHNLNDLTYFTHKHNHYATREAIEIINRRRTLFPTDQLQMSIRGSSWQASSKRWLKHHVYNRVPYQIAALGYFLYRYFFQLGFLDGKEGFAYHFLQGFWYRLLVGAKVDELEEALDDDSSTVPPLQRLSELTGHKLDG